MRSGFVLLFCISSVRISVLCASSERWRLSLETMKIKDFLKHRLSHKVLWPRPDIMGLNIKSEGNVRSAWLSEGPLLPQGAQWTSCLWFSSLPLLFPTPFSQGQCLSGLNTCLYGFSCVQSILSCRWLLQHVKQDLGPPSAPPASTDCLRHPAGTVLGNPCPYCSHLIKSLLKLGKETLKFCPLLFRAVTSTVVPAEPTSQHKIAGGCTVPLKFPGSGRRAPAGTQTAARTSRLPATQLLKILQEKSFLSMQVQHLIKVSFARH